MRTPFHRRLRWRLTHLLRRPRCLAQRGGHRWLDEGDLCDGWTDRVQFLPECQRWSCPDCELWVRSPDRPPARKVLPW